MNLTLDSSVIVASLLKDEIRHGEAHDYMMQLASGKAQAINPWTVLVEVVAAVRRRTGSGDFADEVRSALVRFPNMIFVVLDEKAAMEAATIAAATGLRGMDAVVVQVAKDYNTKLVTFDEEMEEKSRLLS